jgi:hypothetical protein
MYLTFADSASFAYKGSVPDENYAREVMQLFSLGLYALNEDGTQVLDDNYDPVPTYTNDNIVEFAKIWTGFRHREYRGNLEQKRIAQANQVDPMRIDAAWRDPFPKMDLYHGHIGDAYPLCTDLAPQAFLRVGAKFRFLGTRGKSEYITGRDWDFSEPAPNEPVFTPSADSALFATLCNADATTGICQFGSVVTLDTNLVCQGDECGMETIRVIKLNVPSADTPYYYEYVQVPCVSLAFFVGASGGRYIENVNFIPSHDNEDELIERVCADPQAVVAAPGCCSEHAMTCFEYRCAYVEERVSLSTALQRCNSTALWSTPGPPPMPTGDLARWTLYPEAYRIGARIGFFSPLSTLSFLCLVFCAEVTRLLNSEFSGTQKSEHAKSGQYSCLCEPQRHHCVRLGATLPMNRLA